MVDSTSNSSDGRSTGSIAGEVADARQLILPHVETSLDMSDGRLPFKLTPQMAAMGGPAILLVFVSLWMFLTGNAVGGAMMLVASVVLFTTATIAHVTATETMYPHERVLSAIHHLLRRVTLPWGYSKAVANADHLHGISDIISVDLDSGADDSGRRMRRGSDRTFAGALMADGRAVVPIRLHGSNTELLGEGELPSLSASLMEGIDSEITPDGEAIAFYATSRPWNSPVAGEYRTRAEMGSRTRLSAFLSGLLGRIGEWIEEEDEDDGANEMCHFLIVSASGSRNRSRPDAIRRRVSQALAAVGRSRHLEAEALSAHEVINLAAEYWESGAFPDGEAGESASEAAVPPRDIDRVEETDRPSGPTPAERVLTPSWFHERSESVEVGSTVARAFWISKWPEQPPIRFMKAVNDMVGVDLDIKFFGHPKSRDDVLSKFKTLLPKIDSEGVDKAEAGKIDAIKLDDDLDAYLLAYALLLSVNVQPWGLSGYVTVRAPDEDRLEKACEKVSKELKRPPARLSPSAPFGDQLRAFRSVAPFGADHYAGLGDKRHRATKTHLALGGVFGALLPAASPTLSDPGGIRWGRDVTTRRTIQVDPFSMGAGHIITVGPSGSGKTHGGKQQTQEWALNGENRTVIYCDTQGEFEDVVEEFDAEHIVIDGQTGINPLDIRPASAHDTIATDGDFNPFQMKVTDATEFFCGLLRQHGIDPAEYHSIIEQAIQATYASAGITQDPATHSKESPEPRALFETFRDMKKNPEDYTFEFEGEDGEEDGADDGDDLEAEDIRERISKLLVEFGGFKPGGKYEHLLTGTTEGLSPDVDMAYIDMRQLRGDTESAKSVNLQLAVKQVSQLIKQTKGQTVFMVDEAHNLLHSPEMVGWLNKAAREWRRYDALLWLVTQSPQEFVKQESGKDAHAENKRETIVEQATTIQLYQCDGVDVETLEKFGYPPEHADTVQTELISGSDKKGYSECVLSFRKQPGWIRTEVKANPLHAASIEFSHKEGWSYRDRMRHALEMDVHGGGVSLADLEEMSPSEPDAPASTDQPYAPGLAADGSGTFEGIEYADDGEGDE